MLLLFTNPSPHKTTEGQRTLGQSKGNIGLTYRHLMNSQFCVRILTECDLQNIAVSSKTLRHLLKQTSDPIQINGITCVLNIKNILKYFACLGLQKSV